MNEKILTIVVPSYNTEKYIKECLPTFLKARRLNEIEILLVNDGSTDNTLSILNDYQAEYKTVVKVIDKENGGHGSVINVGIVESSGKYFKVIDGDDWVSTNELDSLIAKLEQLDVDLVINSFNRVLEGTNIINTVRFKSECNKVISWENMPEDFGEISIHAITYRTKILKQMVPQLREKCFYEDAEYVLFGIKNVGNFVYLDEPVYQYRIGSTEQSVNPNKVYKNKEMHRLIVSDCIDFFEKNKQFMETNKRLYCEKFINRLIQTQYLIFVKVNYDSTHIQEIVSWDEELREKSSHFYNNRHVVFKVLKKIPLLSYTFLWIINRVYQKGKK